MVCLRKTSTKTRFFQFSESDRIQSRTKQEHQWQLWQPKKQPRFSLRPELQWTTATTPTPSLWSCSVLPHTKWCDHLKSSQGSKTLQPPINLVATFHSNNHETSHTKPSFYQLVSAWRSNVATSLCKWTWRLLHTHEPWPDLTHGLWSLLLQATRSVLHTALGFLPGSSLFFSTSKSHSQQVAGTTVCSVQGPAPESQNRTSSYFISKSLFTSVNPNKQHGDYLNNF